MAEHVLRPHAFRRLHVVGAPRGVDVVVAGPPAEPGGVDPALDGERRLLPGAPARASATVSDCVSRVRLGPAAELDAVRAGREPEHLAVGPVDLRVKREVRGEALRLRRIDPALSVANHEAGHGRLAGFVPHAPAHGLRRADIERDRHRVAAPVDRRDQRALRPDELEREARAARAGVAAVDLEDAVLQLETAQRLGEWLPVEHHQVEPAVRDLVLRGAGKRARLVARCAKGGVGAGAVVHLHQELPPAAFHQLRLRGAERGGGCRPGVDRHARETMAIEHALNRLHGLRRAAELSGRVEALLVGGGEGRAEIVGGGDETLDLREQGLEIDAPDDRQVRPARRRGREPEAIEQWPDARGRAQQLRQDERARGQAGALEEYSAAVHRAQPATLSIGRMRLRLSGGRAAVP